MKEALKTILDIQELDMKMLRLMRVKTERLTEIKQIEALRKELHEQLALKENEIADFNKQIIAFEQKIQEIAEKLKKLEDKQGSIKKVEDFNALTQEMTSLERERINTEQKVSDLVDKKVSEEDLFNKIKESLEVSESSSLSLEKEIRDSIELINAEGSSIKAEREELAKSADPETLRIYERLVRNKRDRVVVPIENRTCSGCHITVTAQHENIVRKGNNLVFCEHCSRIHYWQPEETAAEGAAPGTKRRRRKAPTA
jgi:predicted  nucleic acid-binding Zn-ribbon protein